MAPLTVVHASDVHFGRPHRPAVAAAFLRAARAAHPDVWVVSGDLTQRAKRHEYRAARAFLDGLEGPVVVVPGNHDVPLYRAFERLVSPFLNYRRHISDALDTVTRGADFVAVGLNTAAPRRALVNGRLRPAQVEFAERTLAAADAPVKLAVLHHNLVPAPDDVRSHTLPGSEAIVSALARAGTDVVLSGHLHRSFVASSRDVAPGHAGDAFLIVHAGTATSTRGRAAERTRNSFNVLRIGARFVEVDVYMYLPERGEFAVSTSLRIPRGNPDEASVRRSDERSSTTSGRSS